MNLFCDWITEVAENRLALIRLNSESKLLNYNFFYEFSPNNGIVFYAKKLNNSFEDFPNDGLISICLEDYKTALIREINFLTNLY